jgi:hypothetical protein
MAIETVNQSDSLDQGRIKWNDNDTELEASISDITNEQPAFVHSFGDGDYVVYNTGWRFDLTDDIGLGFEILPGSIQVTVNGVAYKSNTSQTNDGDIDFYLTGTANVIFKDTANSGSLDLLSTDNIIINFSRRKTTQGNPGN